MALVPPLVLAHQIPSFPADEAGRVYGKATDFNYRQLYEITINELCLINQGALIDSELLTAMRHHSVIGYQALLAGWVRPSGPLVQLTGWGYAYQWHLRNAPTNGPALRQRAFLTPQFRLEFGRPVSSIGRRAGIATREGASCFRWQFLRPVRLPALKPGYFPFLGDKPVTNPGASNPAHPLLTGPLTSRAHAQDALNNCAAVLYCLADLFGGDTEKYPVLDSDSARRGMWLQLYAIADVLEATSKAIQQKGFN